jgi:hypothetical protein
LRRVVGGERIAGVFCLGGWLGREGREQLSHLCIRGSVERVGAEEVGQKVINCMKSGGAGRGGGTGTKDTR